MFLTKNMCENKVCIITVPHCVHCAKGEKEERKLIYHFFKLITGIKTKMLMIIVWSLIFKLAWVCNGCEVGTSEVNNLDWNQVANFVLT